MHHLIKHAAKQYSRGHVRRSWETLFIYYDGLTDGVQIAKPLTSKQRVRLGLSYIPSCALFIDEPCTFVADSLIEALQLSNGLEMMPPEQRLELIRLVSLPCDSIHDEPENPQWQIDIYAQLARVLETVS